MKGRSTERVKETRIKEDRRRTDKPKEIGKRRRTRLKGNKETRTDDLNEIGLTFEINCWEVFTLIFLLIELKTDLNVIIDLSGWLPPSVLRLVSRALCESKQGH